MKLFFLAKTLFLTLLATILFSGSAMAFTEIDGTKTTVEAQVGDGKWIVVKIWAYYCHACHKHMPELVQFNGKMKDVRILGISLDGQSGKADTQSMIKEYNIPFKTILSDALEVNSWMLDIAQEGLAVTPTFMIFNPDGKLVGLSPSIVSNASLEKFINDRRG